MILQYYRAHQDKDFKLSYVKFRLEIKKLLPITYRAIMRMHTICSQKSNLMLQHDRAHQDEDFKLSYVKFPPEIKKVTGDNILTALKH